jgi:hypothetical protein
VLVSEKKTDSISETDGADGVALDEWSELGGRMSTTDAKSLDEDNDVAEASIGNGSAFFFFFLPFPSLSLDINSRGTEILRG